MVGSTSVAVAYMAILWVGGDSPSQINCGAQEVQAALDAFPLLETPGDIVSVTGDSIPLVSEAIWSRRYVKSKKAFFLMTS